MAQSLDLLLVGFGWEAVKVTKDWGHSLHDGDTRTRETSSHLSHSALAGAGIKPTLQEARALTGSGQVGGGHSDLMMCFVIVTSPLTFFVGIFSFKNSASLQSTFQGAWIFTNPTPWILV